MSIIDLQEISPNSWKALYQGNYGKYTIKIKIDGDKIVDFSCSCPSDYYPCKHIPMIEKAIRQRIGERIEDSKHGIKLEELLKDSTQKELYDFILRRAKYDMQLKNAILMEFSHKLNEKNTYNLNIYTQMLQNSLSKIHFDYEDMDEYDSINIDELDRWLDKAQEYVEDNIPEEAVLICKACIEEFASWCEKQESYIVENVDISHKERPFKILFQILDLPNVDYKGLLDYCKSEILKPKYKEAEMYYDFNELFMKLSTIVGTDDFIKLQDKLLQEIGDKNSHEYKAILQKKIKFYRNNDLPDEAWNIIEENLQIDDFKKELVEKLIAENKLQEAKKLIDDFIFGNKDRMEYVYLMHKFNELKLQIAQKENDTQEIRQTSFLFIESGFEYKYYNIYKGSFTKKEWAEEVEKLILRYEKRYKGRMFSESIADVLQAEKQSERLMEYVKKYLSIENLAKYHYEFSSIFPEKALALFRQAIDKYAKDNTGREHYERIINLFKKMIKIEGGKELVEEMISQYRIFYKNRKAMMEIINHFQSSMS